MYKTAHSALEQYVSYLGCFWSVLGGFQSSRQRSARSVNHHVSKILEQFLSSILTPFYFEQLRSVEDEICPDSAI